MDARARTLNRARFECNFDNKLSQQRLKLHVFGSIDVWDSKVIDSWIHSEWWTLGSKSPV